MRRTTTKLRLLDNFLTSNNAPPPIQLLSLQNKGVDTTDSERVTIFGNFHFFLYIIRSICWFHLGVPCEQAVACLDLLPARNQQ